MTAATVSTNALLDGLLSSGAWFDFGNSSPDDVALALSMLAGEVEEAKLFAALASHPRTDLTEKALLAAIHATNVLTMMEIASWLGRGGVIAPSSRKAVGEAFRKRAANTSDHYGVRAQALKAAMILAQGDAGLRLRLQADLISLEATDDGNYLRHAARIAGAIHAHAPLEELRELLTRLANVKEATDEALFELGLDALRAGMEATTPEAALSQFRQAQAFFERAGQASESRIDAKLYRSCLNVLVDFHTGHDGDLATYVEAIRQAAFEYTAYLMRSDGDAETGSWLSAKDCERVHWSSLALRLESLAGKLSHSAWIGVAAALEDELLSIYTASRSMFRRNTAGGLEELLRPRIVRSMQKELRSLDILELWIAENSSSGLLPDADALRELVVHAREDLVTHRPSGAAVGSSPTAAIIERLPASEQATIVARIEADTLSILNETASRSFIEVLEAATNGLMENDDYAKHEDARRFFDVVLLHTTRFLVARHDLSVATFPLVAYLFNRSTDNPPLEADLQHDLINFLMGSALAQICTPEARDLGGGRVDVLFAFRWMKTTAELKRSLPKRSSDQLVDDYGPQAIAYQSTNVSFAILMVLDLFDRKGAQPDIRDQISLHHRTVADSSVKKTVVLFRVQGKRHTPSDLGKSALTAPKSKIA